MTFTVLRTSAARVGGRPLARAGLLAAFTLALALPVHAQAVTWEAMPGVRRLPTDPDRIVAVDFLHGEGAQAGNPANDTLVVFTFNGGAFLHNPSGAAGAAGSNGEWGVWHRLCAATGCAAPDHGLVTSVGTLVIGSQAGPTGIARGTNRGRTWALDVYDGARGAPFVEPRLPGLVSPDGTPVILAGTGSFVGNTLRTDGDGAPGTWTTGGLAGGMFEAFGVVPPSASLPNGRLLAGVWNGVTYSDDGGATYVASSAYGQARYIAWSFAFLTQANHPYGGVAYAGVQDLAFGEFDGGSLLRSDDGGATWAVGHRFTAAELELPPPAAGDVTEVALIATPDGALWAGVSDNASIPGRGGIARSTDGGVTWARADGGYRDASGRGYAVNEFALSRTGVLYAATERGVWRTTTAVVASEASPVEASGVAVSVRPNPAGGRVEVVVSLAAAQAVRVVVLDALGREVAVVLDGAAGVGERVVGVDTASWPAGVYVVRSTAGATVASARLVVAR